jgi:hypothetical protein
VGDSDGVGVGGGEGVRGWGNLNVHEHILYIRVKERKKKNKLKGTLNQSTNDAFPWQTVPLIFGTMRPHGQKRPQYETFPGRNVTTYFVTPRPQIWVRTVSSYFQHFGNIFSAAPAP